MNNQQDQDHFNFNEWAAEFKADKEFQNTLLGYFPSSEARTSPPPDRRDSDDMATEAESRGEIKRRAAIARRVKYHKQQCAKIANFEQIGLPDSGEAMHCITTGSFNAYTIVTYAIQQFGHIEYLGLTTFNMHEKVIADLFEQFDSGFIHNLDVMISESVRFRMPKRFCQMMDAFEQRQHTNRIRVKFNWNHSKIILMQMESGDQHCITGSGNLSDNAQFEQYHLSCNSPEYGFFHQWIADEFTGRNLKREVLLK